MMRMEAVRPHSFAFACLISLTGMPAMAADFWKVSLPEHSRVGVASVVQPEFANFHLGVTVFTNVDQRLANDWQLDRTAIEYTRELLRSDGFEPIDVALDEATANAIREEEDWTRLNYSGLQRDWEKRYQALMARQQLDAIVILREQRRPVGTSGRFSFRGSGIWSTALNTSLVTTVVADAIAGAPPHRSIGECIAAHSFERGTEAAEDYAKLDLAEAAWIREPLEALIRQKIAFDLGSSGLLHDHAMCPGLSTRKIKR